MGLISRRIVAVLAMGAAQILLIADPASALYCYSTTAMVACTDPAGVECTWGGEPDWIQQCESLGYNGRSASSENPCRAGGWDCVGATPVPELEDYAAAAFLVLALTIGWQVRQRRSVG